MGKLFKVIAYLIGALILLILIGMILLVTLVNPNKFKPEVVKQIQQATGRPFAINGGLHWTFFPMLGIEASNISLGNPSNFPQGDFITAKSAAVNLEAVSLLKGKVNFGILNLDNLTIHLIKTASGQTNWESANTTASVTVNNNQLQGSATAQNASGTSRFGLVMMTVPALHITNSEIIFDDQSQNKKIDLQNISVQSEAMTPDQAFPVSLSFTAKTSTMPKPVNIKLNSQITVDTTQQKINLNTLYLDINNLNISGQLQINHFTDQPEIQGNLQILNFDANSWLANFGKPLSSNALHSINATFDIQADANSVQFNNLRARVDDSTITGSIGSLGYGPRLIHFDLAIDQLDTTRFMQSDNNKTKVAMNNLSPIQTAQAATATDDMNNNILPVATLRNLNAQGHLWIQSLVFGQPMAKPVTAKQVAIVLNVNNGVLQIAPLSAKVYGGELQSAITIDARSDNPQWRVNTQLTNIDIDQLLQSKQIINSLHLTGSGNVTSSVTSAGNTISAITQYLNGNVKFNVEHGVLQGIDIPYYSSLADALSNKSQPTRPNTHQTPFGEMSGTLQINNGVVNNNDLLMQLPQINVTGSGTADLNSQQLNYELQLQRLTSGSDAKPRGPAIPLSITGPFGDPKISPDWQKLAVSQAQEQLNKQIQDKAQDLTNKFNQTFGSAGTAATQVTNQIAKNLQSIWSK